MGICYIKPKDKSKNNHPNPPTSPPGNHIKDDDLSNAIKVALEGNLTQMVELKFKGINLSVEGKTLPDVLIQVKQYVEKPEGKVKFQWKKRGRTEIIKESSNPQFITPIEVPYHFEEQDKIRIEAYDIGNPNLMQSVLFETQKFIGSCEILLHDVIGARNQILEISLYNPNRKDCGKVKIYGNEKQHKTDTKFTMELHAKDLKVRGQLFFVLERLSQKKGEYNPIYKSKVKNIDQDKVFSWDKFTVLASDWAFYNFKRDVRIKIYKSGAKGNNKLVASVATTIQQIQKKNDGELFVLRDQKQRVAGELRINDVTSQTKYSFLQYVFGGCEISLMIGIDFTKSNKPITDKASLHYPNFKKNQYIQAIQKVGSILQCYDSDKKIPVFGFGSKIPGREQRASHCFALNGNIFDPEIEGMDGVLECYLDNAPKIDFHGPTHFSQIFKMAVDFAEYHKISQHNQKYFILLMITDGQINDMSKTINEVVRGSGLPLSIVIVGVGNDDFKNMDILDGDDQVLFSEQMNKHAERDIVQFVPFRNFKNDPQKLARQTLEEIPRQLLSYFESKKIKPNNVEGEFVPPPREQLQIPDFFVQRKIQFKQFLKQKFPPDHVDNLINYGIPYEDVKFVSDVIYQDYTNQLLMKDHGDRLKRAETNFHRVDNCEERFKKIIDSKNINPDDVHLNLPQEEEPKFDFEISPELLYSYQNKRNQ